MNKVMNCLPALGFVLETANQVSLSLLLGGVYFLAFVLIIDPRLSRNLTPALITSC